MNSIFEEVRIALHGVWQRRWLALAIAWGLALLGWLAISSMTNKYESKASVFVQMQTMLPEKLGINAGERQDSIDGITRTLTSAENLEKVVRGTDLVQLGATTPREVADQVSALRKNIKIVSESDNVFEISATSASGALSNAQNAKLSRDIVQKLLDRFVEGNLAGDRVETAQNVKFLDAQLAQREVQLQEAEAKRAAFEAKYIGLLPGVGSAAQRMENARAQLAQVDSELMSAQGGLAAVNGQLGSTAASTVTPGSVGGGGGPATSRASGIEGQIAEGQARGWTEGHPDMVSLRRQLGSARSAAASEGRRGGTSSTSAPNPLYVTLRSMQAEKQAAVSALGARRAQLQAEMATFQAKQVEQPGVAAEQQRLNRDYEVLKTQYDKLLGDREEIKLRGSLQSDTDAIKFQVIEPPTAPRVPIAPNRPLLLALVLFAALGAGIGAAFALSQLKSTYATAGRLARASGLPVIGSVSRVFSPSERSDGAKKLKWFSGGAAALAAAFLLLLTIEFVQRGMVA
jgi:polysaccharide biosynthesis transport protein